MPGPLYRLGAGTGVGTPGSSLGRQFQKPGSASQRLAQSALGAVAPNVAGLGRYRRDTANYNQRKNTLQQGFQKQAGVNPHSYLSAGQAGAPGHRPTKGMSAMEHQSAMRGASNMARAAAGPAPSLFGGGQGGGYIGQGPSRFQQNTMDTFGTPAQMLQRAANYNQQGIGFLAQGGNGNVRQMLGGGGVTPGGTRAGGGGGVGGMLGGGSGGAGGTPKPDGQTNPYAGGFRGLMRAMGAGMQQRNQLPGMNTVQQFESFRTPIGGGNYFGLGTPQQFTDVYL